MNEETKVYIDSKFNEVNQKIDNLLYLFEKIRNNEIRTLMYSQLTARQLNYFFYVDQIRNQDSASSFPYYEKVANTDKCRKAHALTEICAQDLKDLIVKKSKGRKDLIEDDFTNINKKSNLDIKIEALYKKLPKKYRLQYNSPNLNENRALLDKIIASILSSPKVVNNHYNYLKTLHDIDFNNKEYYGKSSDDNYVDNQIKKLYSKIGNEILSQYKGYNSENYLSSQKEFLSKNIFKLNLKTSNNITEQKQLQLGESLYKIAKYCDLKDNQTKRLIKNWYYRSGFSNSFESYYKSIINSNSKTLTTKEFINTFEELGLSKSKYNKLRDNYYKQKRISNYLMEYAIKYIQYEEDRLDRERENSEEYDKKSL